MRSFFFLLSILLFFTCCHSPDASINQFSDPLLIKIADLQDRRLEDSLYSFLNHENPVYRRTAVQAFGSLQVAKDVDRIGKLLLMDADPSVRKAAAFALGQIQHPSCERILLGALVKEKSPEITYELLQAYGKITSRWQLDPAIFLDDTLKSAGLAWSLYRAGLRGKTDTLSNGVARRLLAAYHPRKARLGAAHYFARGAQNFEDAQEVLIAAARKDSDPEVRMAAALSLGKIQSDSALAALKNIIKEENDPRVIVNAIRGLGAFPYEQTKHYLYEALGHKDVHIGVAASEAIIQSIIPDDWIEVSSLTNRTSNWRIQANLYEAALKAGRNKDLAREVITRYEKASDPYQQAALLGSLKYFPAVHPFVEEKLKGIDTPIVRTAAASTLVEMNMSDHFDKKLTPHFASVYRELIASEKDPAVLGTIASALADSSLGYQSVFRDASFLYKAKEKLQLPEHYEALQPIEDAIAYFEKRKVRPLTNRFNHPIDWDLVKTIPDNQLANIRTSRGSIIIRLLVNEAPGSVANFIALVTKDYYDNKPVHRVVPNFVIQAGCNRGDGWGSEDYSIRSEFSPRRYVTGSVGMASAGKDTEGTQWFITHSPTPHLDGRYTIFAEVIEGLKVMDFIQVGDRILDVELKNFGDR
jgi:cyclophilin family peptidyl-prolyl cis-trans isomerase/HEAT repeat protein